MFAFAPPNALVSRKKKKKTVTDNKVHMNDAL